MGDWFDRHSRIPRHGGKGPPTSLTFAAVSAYRLGRFGISKSVVLAVSGDSGPRCPAPGSGDVLASRLDGGRRLRRSVLSGRIGWVSMLARNADGPMLFGASRE